MIEEWRKIVGYEGLYEVIIRTIKKSIMRGKRNIEEKKRKRYKIMFNH